MRRLILLFVLAPFLLLAVMVTVPVTAGAQTAKRSPVSPRVQLSFQRSASGSTGIRTAFPNMSSCDGAFDAVASPNGAQGNQLFATAAIAPNDAWAVGANNITNTNSVDRTLAEHWNGSVWSIVPTPNPSSFASDLNGVAAISTNDVWAVGAYQYDSAGDIATFAEHWNGVGWSLVTSTPNPGTAFSGLFAVTAITTNNVWAVGTWFNGSTALNTLVEHWDGTSWTVSSSANQVSNTNELLSVSAFSANDVWAGGTFLTSGSPQFFQSLAEHWDGTTWSLVSTPNLGGATANNQIGTITALEAGHAVGVGFGGYIANTSPRQGEAWDLLASGTSTNSIETGPGTGDSVLESIDRSGAAVWAVGYSRATNATTSPPLTLAIAATWNPTSHTLTWGPIGTSASPSVNDALLSVSAISPYLFFAAGIQNNTVDQTLIESYCALQFAVSAPASTTSGSAFSVTVKVQNDSGVTQTAYRGTVHFTSNDPQATLPADYTYLATDNGSHTFSGVVLRTPCAGTITASDLAMPLTSPGSATVKVTPGACQAPGGTAGSRAATQKGVAAAPSRSAANPSGAGSPGQRIFFANAAVEAAPPVRASTPPITTVAEERVVSIQPRTTAVTIDTPLHARPSSGMALATFLIAFVLLLGRFVQKRRFYAKRRP